MRRRREAWLAAALVGALAAASPEEARAQQTAESVARVTFEHGVAELQAQRYASAARAFEESYRLSEVPIVLYNLALAYRGLNRAADAVDAFERYLATNPPGDPAQIAAIRDAVAQLRQSVGALHVVVEPPEAELRIDGRPRALPANGDVLLDAGRHVVDASACGYRRRRVEVTVAPGGRGELAVALEQPPSPRPVAPPEPPRPPPPVPLSPLVPAGALVAGLGAGVTAGLLLAGNALLADYTSRCVDASASDCDALRVARQGQLAAFEGGIYVSVGAAVVGVGLVVYGLVAPPRAAAEAERPRPGLRARLSLGVGSVGVSGAW